MHIASSIDLLQFQVTYFSLIESIYSIVFTLNFASKFGIIFLLKFEQNILHITVTIYIVFFINE